MFTDQPATSKPKLRWLRPTSGKLLVMLLAAEGVLLLSERWFPKGYAVLIAVAAVGVFLLVMLLWLAVALLFRRRFQFSIRSLMLLMVAVAIPSSWLAVEIEKAKKQKEAVEALERLNAMSYDYEIFSKEVPAPVWLRRLLGDDFFRTVIRLWCYDNKFTKEEWEHLGELKGIKILALFKVTTENEGWRYLESLKNLQYLRLEGANVTDAMLEHLEGLKQLENLTLSGTQVTDAGVAKLKKALPYCTIHR